MQIINGKKLRDGILAKVKKEVALLKFQPVFTDVLVGNDPASVQYVRIKKAMAEAVDLSFYKANFPSSITTDELIREIKILNKVPNMCGIIIQLPLPEHIDRQRALDSIDPKLDVDCLGKVASGKFYDSYDSKSDLGFPTALSCMAILDSLHLDWPGKKIVVLGQGTLVGRPVTHMLRLRGLPVETIDNRTENISELLKNADVIVSGIGRGKFINGQKVKKDIIIIDAGTSEDNGAIVGDVDLESVKNIASYVSPVPGGVGPVTVAMLLNNVLSVAKSLEKSRDDSAESNI
ncbi:MAG: Bifunctional protein FolD [Candidatus Nomurabacteria bacterium GW2011_GWF2_43_8]|uniref:Bifunctional protein FolD n=3 Tax=Candidatus Nomuraibacteriota TaxID=1752729 RepID=A0A0G1FRZ2_9BACT|nr:MAG: Bifunctional protein FolD [Candidatus Nomurabacteria bacterium GW2011_GWA2_43_15]KKT19601.1 MAG: Bifunctional protein FolD [Candidatus Nomurabacteria bacterium GW2011_GWB1_43_7]KKT24838.1 MAG: Bifunctional protein FolD [Candidatus Nomurabacteria bacterium GW2011_GWF2_43_8]